MVWPFSISKIQPLKVDIHSHILPGIDDGSQSLEESVNMIKALQSAGFQKLITTPHIHPKYPNTEDKIMNAYQEFVPYLKRSGVDIELEVAAEYYVDERFIQKVEDKKKLLSFGDNYVLIESSFVSKPLFLGSVIFKLKSQGYRPIYAHPERYRFLDGDITWLEELKSMGVLFQVTLSSLAGNYGNSAKGMAEKLVKRQMVDFLASDMHKSTQIDVLKKGLNTKLIQKLIRGGTLLNDTI